MSAAVTAISNLVDKPREAVCAALAGVAFALGLSRFAAQRVFGTDLLNDGRPLGLLLAVVPHLLLWFGVWPRLAVPTWARLAGLWWFVLDLASDVAALAGAAPGAYLPVRYIGHLGAAGWIVGASVTRGRAVAVVGIATSVALVTGSVLAAVISPVALAPSGPLLVAWCLLLARRISQSAGPVERSSRP